MDAKVQADKAIVYITEKIGSLTSIENVTDDEARMAVMARRIQELETQNMYKDLDDFHNSVGYKTNGKFQADWQMARLKMPLQLE